MAATYTETARNKLRALLNTSLISDVSAGFLALAEDVDKKMLSWWEGTLAARPAAGQANRLYRATDTGIIEHDTGTAWEPLYTIKGAYGPREERAFATEYEPSATRPTLVIAEAARQNTVTAVCVATFSVGGIQVGRVTLPSTNPGGNSTAACTFIVPPGQKWKGENIEGWDHLYSHYLPL